MKIKKTIFIGLTAFFVSLIVFTFLMEGSFGIIGGKTNEIVAADGSTVKFKRPTKKSEKQYMQVIHNMTHQKVEAHEKWGSEKITDKKIDEMLEILDEENYVNEKFFREVLNAWKDGDFSNAVVVHNTIWEWQGGTLGEAKRLMTPEEEKEYIKFHFED